MKYLEHEGEKFLVVEDSVQYCKNLEKYFFVGSKYASITAEQGKVGQKVETIMKNGMHETVNIVSYDTATGSPDWIVTQASGEKMVVNDTKFKSIYQMPKDMKEGEIIKPNGLYRPMVLVNENIAIKTSWGETQFIKKGGVLVVMASNDIYGIQKDEFLASYNIIDNENGFTLLNQNLAKKPEMRKPKIFLSVSYPYDNEGNMQLLQQVVQYLNTKGLTCINVRKIEDSNVNLVNEIKNALEDCEGILSVAFNKGKGETSPFIYIGTAMGAYLNLPTCMIVSQDVEKNGMLFEDNGTNVKEVQNDNDLYSEENKELIKNIDEFVEEVVKRYNLKLDEKDLIKFKNAFIDGNKNDRDALLSFLKNFYNVQDKYFNLEDIYVKRPFQIKAFVVENDGFYTTQDGQVFLRKGDFWVSDIDDNILSYGVTSENFNARYLKVNGKENTYISKYVPTVAKNIDDKVEIYGLINPDDKYRMNKNRFEQGYKSLKDYILDFAFQSEYKEENIQEL